MKARPFYTQPGLNVEIYDRFVGRALSAAARQGELDFYRRHVAEAGGPVLELGCGTGRVAWALADSAEVVGLDFSPAMLEQAEARRAAQPPEVSQRVRFVAGDMSDFTVDGSFGLALTPGRCFQGLLEPEAQRSCLKAVWRHLEPGGRLILDLFDPRLELLLPEGRPLPEPWVVEHPTSGNRVTIRVMEHTNDPVRQVLTEIWDFREHDSRGRLVRQEDERLSLRWTYRWEARYLLELAGFQVLAEYSDFLGSPPAYGRGQLWVARKPE